MKVFKKQPSVKIPEEAVVHNMEKVIESNKRNILWLPTSKTKYLKNSKWTNILSILLKNLGLVNPPYYSKYQL